VGVYAARRISSNLKGSTKQFGWLQAPATSKFFRFTNFREPRNHPNCSLGRRRPKAQATPQYEPGAVACKIPSHPRQT
jgi:hypothetical protein